MAAFWSKLIAVAKRDFLVWTSYRFKCVLTTIIIILLIMMGYVLSQSIDKKELHKIVLESRYGISYFPFFLVGMSFSHYCILALRSFASALRREQMMGTLEALFATSTRPSTIIFSMSAIHFIGTSVIIFVYFIMARIFFGVSFSNINVASLSIVFFLTFLSFAGIGIIAASIIMYFKEGDFISYFLGIFLSVGSGSLAPVDALPAPLKSIAYFLPSTYSLEAIRLALFKGYTVAMLTPEIGYLLIFSFFSVLLGLLCFEVAVKHAKIQGSLSHY